MIPCQCFDLRVSCPATIPHVDIHTTRPLVSGCLVVDRCHSAGHLLSDGVEA